MWSVNDGASGSPQQNKKFRKKKYNNKIVPEFSIIDGPHGMYVFHLICNYLISHTQYLICDINNYQPSCCINICLFVTQNMHDIITKIAQNLSKITFCDLLAYKSMKVFRLREEDTFRSYFFHGTKPGFAIFVNVVRRTA